MTSAAINTKPGQASKKADKPEQVQSTRETVESIVVAFVLAFLFRAFVAEAFVIPTGSMAPTLMGAHRDITCEYCGAQFQANASYEYRDGTKVRSGKLTIASTCSNCRGMNKYDFRGNSNHVDFSGDRILVSKFDYVLNKPQRWDVFVFKYYDNARMNYIKRLVGLPGELLKIEEGDVFTQVADKWQIARKPPHKIKAMRRVVSDTDYTAAVLVKNRWPDSWQPHDTTTNAWQVNRTADAWSATLSSSSDAGMLRYYHKVASVTDWEKMLAGQPVKLPGAHDSQLVTDYLAYNAIVETKHRSGIYEKNSSSLKDIVTSENRAFDILGDSSRLRNDGLHWVGDLIAEFNLNIESDTGTLLVDLVEFGVRYQAAIDVATGKVTLTASGENVEGVFAGKMSTTGVCKVSGAGNYRVEMANVDDQITLWVNGSVAKFDTPAVFDSRQFRSRSESLPNAGSGVDMRRPYWTAADPLDAAPIGIGGRDLAMTVNRARVYRDIYYIAIHQYPGDPMVFSDYDTGRSAPLIRSVPNAEQRTNVTAITAIAATYANPKWWAESKLFSMRNKREFQLDEEQYFPMGDNSSHSSDGRAWRGHHYIEEKYLLGKALLVFWPHTWNTPVPYTPNFSRMSLIR